MMLHQVLMSVNEICPNFIEIIIKHLRQPRYYRGWLCGKKFFCILGPAILTLSVLSMSD